MAKEKTKFFRVDAEAAVAFNAVAELLHVENNVLLETLMKEYVFSVRKEIVEVAAQYPAFREKYPFVEQP